MMFSFPGNNKRGPVLLFLLAAAAATVSGADTKQGALRATHEQQRKNEPVQEGGMSNPQLQRELQGDDSFIVGGTPVASATTYPFFVHNPGCGGTLIHDDIILTAAHCREGNDGTISETVYLLGTTQQTGIQRTAIRQVTHPMYSDVTVANDFLIQKLSKSALVNDSGAATGATAISLNTNSAIPVVGNNLKIMGYGDTSSGGTDSQILLEATVQAISDADCNAANRYDGEIIGSVMLCAGKLGGGVDTCQGDSGGPLVDITTNTLVGVVSWGRGCASAQYPGVYAEVSSAIAWINGQVCALSSNPPASCGTSTTPMPTPSPTVTVPTTIASVQIDVRHDDFPEETGWAFTETRTGVFLGLQGINRVTTPGITISRTFSNLRAGDYEFRITDTFGDGICCEFGNGLVTITDRVTGATLFTSAGQLFSKILTANLRVATDGKVSLVSFTTDRSEAPSMMPSSQPSIMANAPSSAPSTQFVQYKFRTDFVYGFSSAVNRLPTAEESAGITRLTQIFFRREVASLYSRPYANVDVEFRVASVRSGGGSSVVVNYETTVFFNNMSQIPTKEKVKTDISSADLNAYVTGFARIAEPQGGLFSTVNAVTIVVSDA